MFMFPFHGTVAPAWRTTSGCGSLNRAGHSGWGQFRHTRTRCKSLVAAIHATNPALTPLVALDQEGGVVIASPMTLLPMRRRWDDSPQPKSPRWRGPAPKDSPPMGSTSISRQSRMWHSARIVS